jgi:Concanavalin A-like lectin/glucanases superfamily
MGVAPRSNLNRRIAAMLVIGGVAAACGRVGYEEVDGNEAAFGSGGSAIDGGGTGIPPVTTGTGGAGTGVGGGGTTAAGGAGAGGAGAGGASIDGGSGAGGTAGTGVDAGDGGALVDGGCPSCNPILYWKLDEASGTQALDSSGHGLNGAYVGSPMPPSRSTLVPPQITFADPSSRQFVTAKQQAVQLANAPTLLKPSNDITVTAWYRSTATDTVGGSVISMGDNYVLFLHHANNGTIELSKVQPQLPDMTYAWTLCLGRAPTYLDGNWHHLAGVFSSAGMRLYFDGAIIGTNPDGSSLVYPLGTDLFVGHHGNGVSSFDFNGNIDDVRIYGRVLSDGEIGQLAQGGG